MYLKLLVFNSQEHEEWVNFNIDINAIHGFYDDPDDKTIINLLSHNQLFTVKRSHELMNKLKFELN